MSTQGLKNWHAIVRQGLGADVASLLADDAVFESPILHTPQRGKDLCTMYLTAAGQVLANDSFHYVKEWYTDNSAVLEFNCEVEGIKINGVDMITWNANDLITHFKVMVRPLKAINLLHAKMAELVMAARSG